MESKDSVISHKEYLLDVLHDVQQALVAPKDLRNNFGKFDYRNAEHLLAAIKPLLPKGVSVMCTATPQIDNGVIICRTKASLMYKTVAISAEGYAREDEDKKGMDNPQQSGSAQTYAKKYALCNLFAVDDSRLDPDDEKNTNEPPHNRTEAPKQAKTEPKRVEPAVDSATAEHDARLKLLAMGVDMIKLAQYYKVPTPAELTLQHLQHALAIKSKQIASASKAGAK
ncbi:hypothetical protein AGMMS49573_07890 [Endomicrobiia bacterium]|nr:hypothetical protein AGMMS49573_07890 [Endomicrobiia bacterium]